MYVLYYPYIYIYIILSIYAYTHAQLLLELSGGTTSFLMYIKKISSTKWEHPHFVQFYKKKPPPHATRTALAAEELVRHTLRAGGGYLVVRSLADVSVHCGQICESKGLVSIDRSEITALLSTTPRLKTRSSTNDLAPQHCTVWYRAINRRLSPRRRATALLWLCHRGRRNRSARVYRCLRT